MPRSIQGRAFLVMLAAALLGIVGVSIASDAPPATLSWPAGLVAGLALVSGRRGGAAVLLVGAVLTLVAHQVAGSPLHHSVGVAMAHTIGAALVIGVMTGFGRRPHALMVSENDVTRYVAAAGAGAVATGVTILLWSWVGSTPDLFLVTAGLALHHAGSQLVFLPWFLTKRHHGAPASVWEQAAQWTITLALTVSVFLYGDGTGPAFAIVAALSWGARRLGTTTALLQLFVVISVSSSLTLLDHGPFAGEVLPATLGGGDAAGLMMRLFVVCCALVVVPLVLTVAVQLESVREASLERDRVQQIMDSAESTSIIGGTFEGITYFSPGAERLLGHRAEDVVGRAIRLVTTHELERLCAEVGGHDFVTMCQALIADGRPHELRLVRKDGVERTHLARLRTIEQDGHLEFVLISEDITARVEEQEAHEKAVARLREIDTAKDTFVSGVSHELRTPLTTMTGFLEMLQDGSFGPLTSEQAAALVRVGSNNRRLLGLVDDLLSFSRLGSPEVVLERHPLDLRDVVLGGCDLVEPVWTAREQVVRVSVPPVPVTVLGDHALIERIVVNLVGNAVKFTPVAGTVDVVLHTTGSEAVLTVRDTGIGIPSDEVDRLFDRFFRSRLAREKAVQGTGLGLSIAKAVVEAHGGRIDVVSTEGVGTTVTACIPCQVLTMDDPVLIDVSADVPVDLEAS